MNEEKITEALNKKSVIGNDIELNKYNDTDEARIKSTDDLSKEGKESLEFVGIELEKSDEQRSATFVQVDNTVVEVDVKPNVPLELMSTGAAAKKYPELVEKYWWKAISPDTDKYTAKVAIEAEKGYFIRVKAGKKIKAPLQSCLFIGSENQLQRSHNIVIVEEGAEINIISGCTSDPNVESGAHLGMSEFYVEKGGKLSFTMIHDWGENVVVRPRTVTIVGEDAQYLSNYISLDKVKDVQMNPLIKLVGKGATTRLNSIVVAPNGSHSDIGGRVMLEVEDTKAEVIAKSISTGGTIINRGLLCAEAENVRAHLECNGLMLSEKGRIFAIPELDSHIGNAELSHEAAVGRISPEEIEYLMVRGLNEEEATATIVRGFLNVNIEGLPESLAKKINDTLDAFTYNKGM